MPPSGAKTTNCRFNGLRPEAAASTQHTISHTLSRNTFRLTGMPMICIIIIIIIIIMMFVFLATCNKLSYKCCTCSVMCFSVLVCVFSKLGVYVSLCALCINTRVDSRHQTLCRVSHANLCKFWICLYSSFTYKRKQHALALVSMCNAHFGSFCERR